MDSRGPLRRVFVTLMVLFTLGFFIFPKPAQSAGTAPTGDPATLAGAPATGQTTTVTRVPGVVISASKIEEPLENVTRSVTVITREEIELRNAQTVRELLREVPGVDVQSSGGSPGAFSQVRIRGANDDQIVVLVNGARVNDLFLGGGFDFGLMPTDNIERIEIVRGGASALYGSDAIGGVIHIITRRGEGDPRLRLYSEGGSHNTFKEGASFAGEAGRTDFSFSYSRLDSNGLRPGPFNHSHTRENNYSMLIGHDFGPKDDPTARLQATFNASTQDLQSPYDFPFNFDFSALPPGAPFSIQTFDPNNNTERKFFTTTETLMVKPTDWWKTDVRFSLTQNRLKFKNSLDRGLPFPELFGPRIVMGFFGPFLAKPVTNLNATKTADTTIEIEVMSHLTLEGDRWKNVFTAGYHFERNHFVNDDFSTLATFGSLPPLRSRVSGTRDRNAHFYQNRLTLWDRLFLTAGLRVDQQSQKASIRPAGSTVKMKPHTDSLFGIEYNPSFSGALKIDELGLKIHGAWSRNFSAPTFSDLFFPGFSNPELRPEKAYSMEGGVSFSYLDDRVGGDITYYRINYEDLIVFVTLSGPPFFSLENKAKAKTEGLEISAFAGRWKGLKIATTYTFLDSQDDVGNALQRRPRHKGSATLSYVRDRLSLLTEVNYVGGSRDTFDFLGADGRIRGGNLPRYHTASFSGSYDLLRDRGPVKRLQVYARINNLFDTSFEEVKGFPAAGVTAFGGVRIFMF